MKKREEQIMDQKITFEEPKEIHIVVVNKKPKTRLVDSIKFGAGFYIGFKLARTAKYALIKIATKK